MIIKVRPQNPRRIAIGIIELMGPHRPKEERQSQPTQKQRDRDQKHQNIHIAPYFSRSAFSVTVIDDSDIAKAAASGVAIPISAKGTAITL